MKTTQFGTLKKQVERILELYPKTRENDAFLTVYLWKEFYSEHLFTSPVDNRLSVRLASIPQLPSEDSISRARRKIQEEGRFLPGENVTKNRRRAQDDWKEALGYYS